MDNTQKKQNKLSVIQFISSCNKCRRCFCCDLDRLLDGMPQPSQLICQSSPEHEHPKPGMGLGFPTPWKPGWLMQGIPPRSWFGDTGGSAHCAGVLHTSLLSSSRAQPRKQTALKSSGASSVPFLSGQAQP